MKRIRVVEAKGDNYEVGYSIGEQTKEKLQLFLNRKKERKTKILSEKSLKLGKKIFPNIIKEIKGMADGAEVDFNKLLVYNMGLTIHTGCSTLITREEKRKKILIGHNEDLSNNDIFLTKIKIPGKPKTMNISYYGAIPGMSVSINSKGFIQTMNALNAKDKEKYPGFSATILCRKTAESSTIQEAINIIKKGPRLRGGNYIYYKKDKFKDVETTAKKFSVFTPKEKFYIHTNHYLRNKLLNMEGKKKKYLDNSISRLIQAKTILEMKDKINFNIFKKTLSSHNDSPNNICRHADINSKKTRTAGTILIDSSQKKMSIAYGNPCESKFYDYEI